MTNKKTKIEKEQAVKTATAISRMDGYTENNDFLQPFINGEKDIDQIIDEILKS